MNRPGISGHVTPESDSRNAEHSGQSCGAAGPLTMLRGNTRSSLFTITSLSTNPPPSPCLRPASDSASRCNPLTATWIPCECGRWPLPAQHLPRRAANSPGSLKGLQSFPRKISERSWWQDWVNGTGTDFKAGHHRTVLPNGRRGVPALTKDWVRAQAGRPTSAGAPSPAPPRPRSRAR